jgi:hypothetical protein
MKDVFALAVSLVLLVALVVTLWNASSFLRNFGGNYATFQSQTKVPIGDAKVPIQISNEEIWKSTNPTLPGVSPHKDTVKFDVWDSDATNEDAAQEYLAIRAAARNTAAVRVNGWSIDSLVSGVRMPLPKATLLLRLGEDLNKDGAGKQTQLSSIYLAPGEFLYAVTGTSPAGTSFHTNTCIGQLMNYQTFYPRLPESCPVTSTLLPATLENLKNMGEQCLEYISTIPPCEIPTEASMPVDLLPACKAHILQNLTYAKCLDTEEKKGKFKIYNGGGWYTYFEQPNELWRNKYDIIRLLDAEGRVVDVYSY